MPHVHPDFTSGSSHGLLPGGDALLQVRALVRDKTRFAPDDLQQLAGSDSQQAMRLCSHYALTAMLRSRAIDGASFAPAQDDVESASAAAVEADAGQSAQDRLGLAQQLLQRQLQDGAAYDAIADGVYLGHQRRHWHLARCSSCAGCGRVDCYTCHGRRQERCDRCNGDGRVICGGGCLHGKSNCHACGGTGKTRRSESYTEPVQVADTTYHNGQSHTSYRTEYRTAYRTVDVPCMGCLYGKVNCGQCGGAGMVNCQACHGSGAITCRSCHGNGDLQCSPCAGSGRHGKAAWVDVDLAASYSLQLPADAPADVARIAAAGPHALAAIADALSLQQVQPGAGEVRADYTLLLRLVRLDVACNGHSYQLLAYGQPLAWHTLDDIVEDLLRSDLQALEAALGQLARSSMFSTDVSALLQPLHAVAASELNADVIEAMLDGDSTSHGVVVSADYAGRVRQAVLGALGYAYTRVAKRHWWRGALATAALTLGVWALGEPVWALGAGATAAAAGLLVFRLRLRSLLTGALGGRAQASRAMALAQRGKRHRLAYTLVLGPALLTLLGLGALMHKVTQHARQATVVVVKPATAAQRAQVAPALAQYAAGDLAAARHALEALARKGNPAAAGAYGWMVLQGEGLSAQEAAHESAGADAAAQARARAARAQPWIEGGLAAGDLWAQAARGAQALQHGDREQGIFLLGMAAGRQHLPSMLLLGQVYREGKLVPADPAAARKWYTQAADAGSAAALYQLGAMAWLGEGASPDRAKATALWRQAAAAGNADASRALKLGRLE